jgi:hypothetical protein
VAHHILGLKKVADDEDEAEGTDVHSSHPRRHSSGPGYLCLRCVQNARFLIQFVKAGRCTWTSTALRLPV